MNKSCRPLCFTTCADGESISSLRGAISSIRKFYTEAEADIVVFMDRPHGKFDQFCRAHAVNVHLFKDLDKWVLPLVYEDPQVSRDTRHFYHPEFEPVDGLGHHSNREAGFNTIRHLHPTNVKAYCTGYCLCVAEYDKVVYMDPYAFLLSRVDDIWQRHPSTNTIVAFRGTTTELSILEPLFDTKLPEKASVGDYAFDAGIVFYNNGRGVRELARDYMFYSDSCYHWTYAGSPAGQGILRALVAKHCLLGNLGLSIEDGANWNPAEPYADSLSFDQDLQRWNNNANGSQQFMWRGDGPKAVQKGRHSSPSIYSAWEWAGGTHAPDWREIYGALTPHNCTYVATLVAAFFSHSTDRLLEGLEVGTYCGRTSIAFCSVLQDLGFTVHIDTCDIFAPTPDYPEDFPSAEKVQANIQEFGMDDYITSHKVGENESLPRRFGDKNFDFVYIDGSHEFKQVAADIVAALKLVKDRAIIIGDDFNLQDVKDAVYSIFDPQRVKVENCQWSVEITPNADGNLIVLLPKIGRI